MRALLVVLLLLVPLAPLGQAQDAKPALTDATGDVALSAGPSGSEARQPASGPLADPVDLVGLALAETEEGIRFTLQVASLDARGYNAYDVKFTWRDQDHILRFATSADFAEPTGTPYRYACLLTDDDGDTDYVWCWDVSVDDGAKSYAIEVPKYAILDSKDRMPLRGDVLTGFRVDAVGMNIMSGELGNLHFVDAMPDDEGAGIDLTLQRGDAASGTLRLVSEDRVRVSNGGATTFVFKVTVLNSGETDEDVQLSVGELPEGWTATVQSPVRVPARGERVVPLLASVPFAHEHGGFSSFNVSAVSQTDAGSYATMRLGVLHTPIPQPAGHHPDLYLHGEAYTGGLFSRVFPYTWAYMNTDSGHEGDAEEIPGFDNFEATNWWIYMNPGLEMGLDFDVEKTGAITGQLLGRGTGEGRLSAKLYLWTDEDDDVLLAESDEATVTLDPTNPSDFTLTLTPTEDADYIPYGPDQGMYVEMRLERDMPSLGLFGPTTTVNPALLSADWKMTLPLNEYHDKLTGEAEAASSVQLVADGPVEKAGRPGTTLTYTFGLKSDADGTYEVDVAGADALHAALTPSGEVSLIKGETRTVTLAVRIPAEAAEGDELEVLLFVHDQEDPSKTAIARTKTKITLGGEAAPDEEQVFLTAQESDNETPAPGAMLALVAAGLAAIVLGRRRKD